MTPSEFKAWFDGFTEALDGVPSKDQWARIKKRVGEIDGRPVTERVFVDRYVERHWPQYIHHYWSARTHEVPLSGFTVTCAAEGNSYNGLMAQAQAANNICASAENPIIWDGEKAMFAFGRVEAASIS